MRPAAPISRTPLPALLFGTALLFGISCNDANFHGSVDVADGLVVRNTIFEFQQTSADSCPRKIGTTRIENQTGAPVSFRQTMSSSSVGLEPSSGEVATGTTKVTLSFTCSPATSFSAEIELTFDDAEGVELGTALIYVDGQVG